jgi:hypothetical protein
MQIRNTRCTVLTDADILSNWTRHRIVRDAVLPLRRMEDKIRTLCTQLLAEQTEIVPPAEIHRVSFDKILPEMVCSTARLVQNLINQSQTAPHTATPAETRVRRRREGIARPKRG